MKKITLKIEGMTCSACSNGLEKYLNRQDKIIDAIVNLVLSEATIYYEDDLSIDKIEEYIKELGFTSLGESTKLDIRKSTIKERNNLIILLFLLIIFLYLTNASKIGLPKNLNLETYPYLYVSIMFILTIPFLYVSKDILKTGIKSIKNKMPNMDSLVTISITASFFFSIFQMFHFFYQKDKIGPLYFDSVAMILFFVKLGRYLDKNTKAKTVSAIEELVQITPEKALLKEKNTEREITIDEVMKDDILIAKPGMKIAVDGIILKGNTHLDESFITGESKPVKKKPGDSVIAGSQNLDGVVEYQAKKIGKNSMISEIVHLVTDAINTKAPSARLADKVSSYFVPVLSFIAIITFITYLLLGNSFYQAFEAFITILVVACPCALGLATPLSIVVATSLSAKNKILIKSSEVLENASKIDTILFDKTKTLTKGNLEISEIILKDKLEQEKILKIVTSIENNSTHPIKQAFLKYQQEKKIKLLETTNFQNIEGIGVSAKVNKKTYYLGNQKLFSKLTIKNTYQEEEQRLKQLGNSIVYIIEENKVIGIIGLKDKIKKEAKEVISTLKKQGKEIIMLTGDNKETATKVANELGITNVVAEVMPKEKRDFIKKLKDNDKKVMMVGDGINDAPSLALADIGISVSGATDIATNSADVIFFKNDLTSILDLVIISKKTLQNINKNLFWAFFYNTCMIPIAIGLFKPLGIKINPTIASIAMTLSSLTVILNSLRLKK